MAKDTGNAVMFRIEKTKSGQVSVLLDFKPQDREDKNVQLRLTLEASAMEGLAERLIEEAKAVRGSTVKH